MSATTRDGGDDRDIAGNVVASLVVYVARAAGDEAVERLRRLTGETLTADELRDDARWYAAAHVERLADAAAVITGDPDIGRRAGEELFRTTVVKGIDSFLKAAGSPAAAIANAVAYGSKMSQGRPLTTVSTAEREVVLAGRYDGISGHPFLCSFGPGFWSQVPTLFGVIGTAIEERCQRRGDDRCVYRVRWDVAVTPDETELLKESASAEGLIGAFERLQATASELAQAESLQEVLERIVAAADRALVAPVFVAAIRHGDGRVVAAGLGLDDDEVEACAHRLFDDPADVTFGLPVIAPLVPKHAEAGLLAALLPSGAVAGEVDERLLAAYAGHASAVLDAVLARELAERNDAVSRGLLALAQRLAAVATPAEVCDRVVDAVVQMLGADFAAFWRWDENRRVLDIAALRGRPVEHVALDEDDVNGFGGLDTDRTVVILDIDDVTAPKLVDDMVRTGVVRAAVVPVSARGRLLGLVTAGFAERVALGEDAMERLHGLADLAATALDNALLVEHMRHQSLHDALTGLPNRPLIEDRVHQAVRQSERSGRGLALMFIDLDRFKNVNDTLGHTAGDALIRQVSGRLAAAIRAEDTLARMGGDEFVLLLPGAGAEAAEQVAAKIIASMRQPFELDGRPLFVSCSIGIALWPVHGHDYERLLLHADAAMYEAKARGRNTFAIHSGHTTRRRELLDLDSRLHLAIDHDELVVVYQPQVDLMTSRMVGVEALVRWEHPDLGLLTPDRFLHLAEESGVITRIDAWVRTKAFAQARAWADAGTPLRVAVNLSTADLRRGDLVGEIEEAASVAGIDPASVELEITDRVALGEETLRPVLDALAATGMRLAVDDFGVGSSVLGRLQHGPFHTLKVDRSLVAQLEHDSRQVTILQALTTMAHELGLAVVAEGVETAGQELAAREVGCELAQGYAFSRPVAPDRIGELLVELATGARPGR